MKLEIGGWLGQVPEIMQFVFIMDFPIVYDSMVVTNFHDGRSQQGIASQLVRMFVPIVFEFHRFLTFTVAATL